MLVTRAIVFKITIAAAHIVHILNLIAILRFFWSDLLLMLFRLRILLPLIKCSFAASSILTRCNLIIELTAIKFSFTFLLRATLNLVEVRKLLTATRVNVAVVLSPVYLLFGSAISGDDARETCSAF